MANDDGDSTGIETTTVGGHEIQAVKDGDMQDLLGATAVYVIGPHFTVNREWLVERANQLGIDETYLPSETTARRAFTRAAKRAPEADLGLGTHPSVEVETERDDDDSAVFNVEAIDRRGDEVDHQVIGEFEIDGDQVLTQTRMVDPEYAELFSEYADHFVSLWNLHKESNNGTDIRRMIRNTIKKPEIGGIKMRDAGAVYFVPRAGLPEMQAMQQLLVEIDENWKTSGFEAALDLIEVVDKKDKRDMVERKARKALDRIVESALTGAFDELDEDTAAQDVLSEVGEDLVRAESVSAKHNALLDVEISVREVLEEWQNRVVDEKKEELVEAAIEEVDV